MSLEIMFGINASGKDSLVKELKSKRPNIETTTETRLLMYHLGYISDFRAEAPVDKASYKALENTPQPKVIETTNSIYKEKLSAFSESETEYFLLSHLVFALTIDKDKPIYLTDRPVPPWYRDISQKLIQVVCDPDEILRRRLKDKDTGVRDRGNMDSLKEIVKHQSLCNIEWQKLIGGLPESRYITIINNDSKIAVNELETFLNK